jgi:hypothetical protein
MEGVKVLEDSIEKMYRDNGREITDDEAKEASYNLVGFFKLLMEIDRRELVTDYAKEHARSLREKNLGSSPPLHT